MTDSFTAQVNAIIEKNAKLLIAVGRAAIGDVIDDASTTKAKGGRMPVKTGFLRKSGAANIGSMPRGPTRGDADQLYASADQYGETGQIRTVLAALEPGDTFYFGWSAEYANVQNTYNGFLDGALQNWQGYVKARASEAIRRSK
jgi:hypothetical protein